MSRMIKPMLFVLILSALFSAKSHAQTITAASCNESDVAKALSSVNTDGMIVVIPAGNCIWTVSLSYTQTNSFTLQGAGAIFYSPASISGTGSDTTIIQDNVNHSSSDPPLLGITLIPGKTFRMTGIAFTYNSGNSSVTYNGSVRFGGTSASVRIDHNHFNQIDNVDLNFTGCLQGVIDHNQFDAGFGSENQERFQGVTCNGDPLGFGNGSWAQASNFGSSGFMFSENNNFQWVNGTLGPGQLGSEAFDCEGGGRFVFRNNTTGYHVALQIHGEVSNIDNRGCRAYEVYNNTFAFSSNPTADQFAFLVMLESGTSLWWGNTVTGFNQFIHEDVPRTNTATYPIVPTPGGWGGCGTTIGPSNWDGNTNSTGYPCLDQVGRGKGDMLTGAFPSKVDVVANAITWPNQAPDPVYVWGNTYNPVPQESDYFWTNFDSATVENRDYYLQLPNYNEPATFNATAGVGQGLLAARPATCAPAVGYWATDTTTLYVCTATNTWTAYYTPFTYPHPLDTSATPPAPATNLAAIVN